jgi:integrase
MGLSSFRSRIWKPATERAGVAGLRIHDLRHTAVSLWIAAGHEPKEIAAWAGHRSVVTVYDRYGHLLNQDDADPMGKLDALLIRRRPKTGTVVPIR